MHRKNSILKAADFDREPNREPCVHYTAEEESEKLTLIIEKPLNRSYLARLDHLGHLHLSLALDGLAVDPHQLVPTLQGAVLGSGSVVKHLHQTSQ